MFPQARKDRLTVRELPAETLVYDQERHKGHCLNATAALIWRHCDGKTSVDELARLVAKELGIVPAPAVVGLALEQLGRRHLLGEAPPPLPPAERMGRRDALKKLAVAAAAVLPLVLTIATKTAAQSISDDGSSDPPPPPPPPPPLVSVNVSVSGGSSGKQTKAAAPSSPPCRSKGQSCLAASSGQQGTCCAGLTCSGVSQGAGVCG